MLLWFVQRIKKLVILWPRLSNLIGKVETLFVISEHILHFNIFSIHSIYVNKIYNNIWTCHGYCCPNAVVCAAERVNCYSTLSQTLSVTIGRQNTVFTSSRGHVVSTSFTHYLFLKTRVSNWNAIVEGQTWCNVMSQFNKILETICHAKFASDPIAE